MKFVFVGIVVALAIFLLENALGSWAAVQLTGSIIGSPILAFLLGMAKDIAKGVLSAILVSAFSSPKSCLEREKSRDRERQYHLRESVHFMVFALTLVAVLALVTLAAISNK